MANQYDIQDAVEGTVQAPGDGLTVAAAAYALATSKEAIRQRIRRGTLQATKVAGEWRIFLEEQSTPTLLQARPHGTAAPPTATPYTTDHSATTYTKPPTPYGGVDATNPEILSEAVNHTISEQPVREDGAAVVAAYQQLVAQVREENQFLKVELRRKDELFQTEQEAHRRDVSELHVLLQRAQAQIPMPTMAAQPEERQPEDPASADQPRRRWWWPFAGPSY
jgi:hypothetical protein